MEADRAEIMAQANEVIDFFLNGLGSFTPDGPRKPPVNAPVYDSTVRDLNAFKDSVVTAKQYADDPNHILDSVIELISKTVDQLNRVAGDRDPAESDRINREPPDLTDPIDRRPPEDRAPTNPPSNGSVRGQPMGAPADDKPIRSLGQFTYNPSATSDSTSLARLPAPPQGPLTLNEAYLEYQRRLNAARSQGSAPDAPASAVNNPATLSSTSVPTPPAPQSGVATIGPGNGEPPVRLLNPRSPFGNGTGNWATSVGPAGPQYFPQPAPLSSPPSDQPGGLLGMLLDYLRDNPDLQSGAARANAAPR